MFCSKVFLKNSLQISLLILSQLINLFYSTFAFLMMLIDSLNPLQSGVAFLLQPGVAFQGIPSENIRKPLSFLMFSRGIEKQHRDVMG